MGKVWIPKPEQTVVLRVHVEGEELFEDDYPWGARFEERAFHEDGVSRLADRLLHAVMNVEGVTGVSISWDSRSEGGSNSRFAGLEPGE